MPKREIAENGYDLIHQQEYKKVEYVPVEVSLDHGLMADLHELELGSPQGWRNWRNAVMARLEEI